MTIPAPGPGFDAPSYLVWETEQPEKSEYLDGKVFAIADASEAVDTLAGNLFMALRNYLPGKPCCILISNMKLRAEAGNNFFYPDIFVICTESGRTTVATKRRPPSDVFAHHVDL